MSVAFSLDFELSCMPISVPAGLGPNKTGLPTENAYAFRFRPFRLFMASRS
jgi:hypothetical protein